MSVKFIDGREPGIFVVFSGSSRLLVVWVVLLGLLGVDEVLRNLLVFQGVGQLLLVRT